MTMHERVVARPASGAGDFARLYDLAAQAPDHVLHLADLPWRLASPSSLVPERIRLWETPDGDLLAWAMLQFSWHCLDYAVRSDSRAAGLDAAILGWVTERLGEESAERGEPLPFYVSARNGDETRIAAVIAAGFVADDWSYVHLVRDLDEPIPEPVLPDGFSIRSLAGEDEVDAYVAMHRAAFDSTSMTAEWRRATLRDPHYDPTLDLVAITAGGDLAGFCVGWLTPPLPTLSGQRVAQVEPLGVHPAHQRAGLGRALLLEIFRRARALGAVHIEVDTVSYEEPAQETYAAVGFRQVYEAPFFFRSFG